MVEEEDLSHHVKIVKNGVSCGSQNVKKVTMRSVAAYAMHSVQKACGILDLLAIRKLKEEVWATL